MTSVGHYSGSQGMGLTRREMLKLSLLGSATLLLPLENILGGGTGEPLGTFRDASTSFGTVALRGVEKLPAFTAGQVAVMDYGIRDAAPPVNNVLVQTSVALTNVLKRPIDYSPDQFGLLREGSEGLVSLLGSTVQAGTLRPGASVAGTLSFVVLRDGSRLWLEFLDRESAAPILLDLGRIDATPTDTTDGLGNEAPSRRGYGARGGHH